MCKTFNLTLKFRQQNDITGYTPYGARAIDEYGRYQEFFSAKGLGVAVYIFFLAKDGGTMLREPYLKEAIDVGFLLNVKFAFLYIKIRMFIFNTL